MASRQNDLDVLVIGTGIAGLCTAIALSGQKRVAVLSKQSGGGGSTQLAQGGIAAALEPGDSAEAHAADTVAAAAGLGDPTVALAVAGEAVEAVANLAHLGVHFDPGALAKEGGHGRARVAHAHGDATGAEITRALLAAARERQVPLWDNLFLVDMLTTPDRSGVTGALVWDSGTGLLRPIHADTVVLASGGYGQLWAGTTSSPACTGDGLAAALRAGAQVADLELVQFHPTGMDLGWDPRPLASEALRGAGARLRDARGDYLSGADGSGDLAPRDVVSRAMAQRMAELGSDHCYLDATMFGPAVADRFPTFAAACHRAGLDPTHQWVPVSPTTHYTMGGILTDADGRTTLEGLLAVGEVASSGLHGANRLASNSLLEGAVIAQRAASLICAQRGPTAARSEVPMTGALALGPAMSGGFGADDALDRPALRRAMQANAGVARDEEGLALLAGFLAAPFDRSLPPETPTGAWELANMVLVAQTVVALALRRTESRGAHWRTDYPGARAEWKVRQVAQMGVCGDLVVGNLPVRAEEIATAEPVAPMLAPGL